MAVSIALFDLGNVVARWDAAPRIAEYGRRTGLDADEVRARLSTDDFWQRTDRGDFTADEMAQGICELLGFDFSRDELLVLQAAAFVLEPEVLALARAVGTTTRIGILTNNAPLLQEAVPVHFAELCDVFDPILYSFEFGCTKPDARLFAGVETRLGVPPSEIFFTDDSAGHVEAARAAGWDAVHYRSAEDLGRELADRGLIGG